MKDTLLKALLKSKADENASVEALIEHYLDEVERAATTQTERLVGELLVYLVKEAPNIPKEALLRIVEEKIAQLGYTLPTRSLESIYTKSAEIAAASVGAAFSFDATDAEVMSSMYRALTWMKDDGTADTQNKLKKVIAEAMEGEVNIERLGEVLRERLGDVVEGTGNYFQAVSEHVIRQSQSLARVEQFTKAGIEEVKVVAVIDSRTSAICRSMHGRIIPLEHLRQQANAILAAQSVEEKKAASRWQSQPLFGKLPSDVGLPPYHFRCRTVVVAYFRQKTEIDGKNVNGSLLPGETYKGKKVLFSHVDPFGYERVVTEKSLDHGGNQHNLRYKEIIAGINSMERLGLHATQPPKTVGYSKDKNLFFSFLEEEVVTVFRPTNKNYFKENAAAGTIESRSVKKGEDDEKSDNETGKTGNH